MIANVFLGLWIVSVIFWVICVLSWLIADEEKKLNRLLYVIISLGGVMIFGRIYIFVMGL